MTTWWTEQDCVEPSGPGHAIHIPEAEERDQATVMITLTQTRPVSPLNRGNACRSGLTAS